MAKYNHMYSICFSLENENEDGTATKEELLNALFKRWKALCRNDDEVIEAVSVEDTYEVEKPTIKGLRPDLIIFDDPIIGDKNDN